MADVLGALASINTLLEVVVRLVQAVMQARGAVRDARQKTQELLAKVESSQKCLLQLSQITKGAPLPEVLDSLLRQLANELILAMKKVEKFMDSNERRQSSNLALEAAKSLLGQGVTQQNKKTLAIIQGLEKILKEIDRHVLYFVATKVADPAPCLPLQFLEHGLVAWMSTLADQNEEGLQLATRICKKNSTVWCDPSKSSGSVKKRPVVRVAGRMRAAREGGHEVPHSTKVRFSMSVAFDRWCFYVLTYDRWEDTEPQVFFPKSGNNINNWISRY